MELEALVMSGKEVDRLMMIQQVKGKWFKDIAGVY
jgi:hypothetical protein